MRKFAALLVFLFCAAVFAQGGKLPKIAVYVTGDLGKSESRALGTEMLDALVKSGRYIAVERSEAFVAAIDKEHVKQRSGAVDDSQISALGKQFGVGFICVADVAAIFGAHQVSARIIDVETAQVVMMGKAGGVLNSIGALMVISNDVVNNMFGGAGKTVPGRPESPRMAEGPEPARVAEAQEAVRTADPPEMKATLTKIDLEIGGFTMEQRRRAASLNLIPGVGSLVVQQDYVGAVILGGTGIPGWIMYISGMATVFEAVDELDKAKSMADKEKAQSKAESALASMSIGLGLWGFSMIYGMIRAGNYKKPAPKAVAACAPPHQGLNLAILPGTDGNLKTYASYSMEF